MVSVLIIGSSRGIGLELARQYLIDGCDVHATTRSGEVPSALASFENQPKMYALDVREMRQINAMVESLANAPIDILVISAGIYDRVGGQSGSGPAIPEDEVMAVNAIAPMNVAEALFPNLKAAENGRMIFISSAIASRRRGMQNSVYANSKRALNDAIRRYAPEWAQHGVSGLALHPGWVITDMGGADGQVTPEDSAAGIRWIADGMSLEHNGGFYNYQGDVIPW